MKQFRCRQRPRGQLPAMISDVWIFVFFILTVQSQYQPQGSIGHLGTARPDPCASSKISEALNDSFGYFCPSSRPGHLAQHTHTHRHVHACIHTHTQEQFTLHVTYYHAQ